MQISTLPRLLPACLCLSLSFGLGAQTLLVVNQTDSTISLLNPASARQTAVIAERTPGVHGHEVAVSADGRTAYIPIYGNVGVGKPGIDGHEMLVLDIPSQKIIRHIDFGHGVRPHLPVLDSAHGLLYVTTEIDKTVTVLDQRTLKIIGTVPTGQEQSHMLVLSHDGQRGYTANVGPGTVSVLDLKARKTLAIIPVSKTVQRIAISNDDKLVFTSDQTRPRLAVIDTATNQVKTWVPLPGLGYGAAPTRDGHFLLVAIPSTNQVAVVDLHSLRVVRTIGVPALPQEILIRPDGDVAYVSCSVGNKVAAIDLSQWKIRDQIAAGGWPDGMAWAR